MYCCALIPCFSDHPFFVSDFRQLPRWSLFKFFPLFVHCCLRIWYFHCLRHRNEFVHKIAVVQWIHSSSCNMIFMPFMKSSFHTLARRFVGFNNAGAFCLTISRNATGFPVLFASGFCKALQLASELPAFYAHFLKYPWIFVSQPMKQVPRNFLALSSFGVSIAHFCFSFRLDASDISFKNSGHKESALEGRLLSCQSPSPSPRPCISIRWFFIQYREPSEACPRIWQFSISINVPTIVDTFSNIISSDVLVALVTSMYFSGIRNDATLGTYSLTLGSTCWR